MLRKASNLAAVGPLVLATPVSEEQSPLAKLSSSDTTSATLPCKGRQSFNGGNNTLAPNDISLAPTTVPTGSAPRQSFNTAVRTSCTKTGFIHTFHQTLVVEKG
uniref:Putative secreted protein n=1 Tax=Ixodes ricinus TaxID=34613 RepID=A0A6B0U7R4_IXORI